MHFVETMSLYSGLKSSRPFIQESFFPVVPEKYITICTEDHQSKQWDGFYEYIELIKPILNKNGISIIEIGANTVNFKGVVVLKKVTNPNHWSFIVKNSLLHIGPESFINSLAAYHNVPCITLFSNTSPEYASPEWIKSSAEQVLLLPNVKNYKPSFSAQEPEKSINKIYAEEVISKSLEILNIENTFNKYNIFYVGNFYFNKTVELIPNFAPPENFLLNSLVNIRLDYHFNTSVLPNFASKRKVALISDRVINQEVLDVIKPNLNSLHFKVDQSDDPDYYLKLKQKGFNVHLLFKDNADDCETKLNFFDWQIIEDIKKEKKDLDNHQKICDTTRYKSSKIIFSKEGRFSSKASYDRKIQSHEDQMIIDEKDFWDESHYFKLYNLN